MEYLTVMRPRIFKSIDAELVNVGFSSPIRQKRIVRKFAVALAREARFDFAPYNESCEDKEACVFSDAVNDRNGVLSYIPWGACGFRPFMGERLFSWVWILPSKRGQCLLSKFWDQIVDKYAPFVFEPPFTKSGLAFAKHYGTIVSIDDGKGGKIECLGVPRKT